MLRYWFVLTSVTAVLACAISLARTGLPSHWALIVVLGAILVIPGTIDLKLPSRLELTPSTTVMLAAIAILPAHDRAVGALFLGICAGPDWKRLGNRHYLLVAFNAAQLSLAGLAAAEVWSSMAPRQVGAVLATALTFVLVNGGLVVVGLMVQTGQSLRYLLADLRTMLADPPFAIMGLLIGGLYVADGPVALLLIVVPAVVNRIVFAFLARSRHAYERLESVFAFTRELDSSPAGVDPVAAMLAQLCDRLGVRAAQVVVDADGGGWTRHRLVAGTAAVRESGADVASEDPPVDQPALVADLDQADPVASALRRLGMGDGMVAPLLVDGHPIGTLAVAGTPNQRALTGDDLRLLETFAAHVAVFLERNRLVERLRHDSTHDQLTGLANRQHFVDLVAVAARPTTILLVDLDRFKEINDTLGHDHGDLLLQAVGARLTDIFAPSVVARLGGDEFGVLLPGVAAGEATGAAVGLLAGLEQPFPVGVLNLELTASVGLAVAADEADAAKLLQQADVAMYTAKVAHSGWELYTPERDHHSPWRLSLASDLRRGLEDEIEVHFQPKATVCDGTVRGVEALARWNHPRYGLLSPDQFVAVAEQAGLIRPLTMAVLSTACAQQTRLEVLGFPLDIAINLSVRSVLDVGLPDQVAEVLERHGVAPTRLTLEITEGSLMADPARTIGVLGRLAATGIAISIDDFGTGYSSLTYLKGLPATEVKIDRSFVSGMLRDRRDEAIVRSTIDLAHNLGLRAVAEGIEDPGTWAALAAIGCDEGQGYFLSAPLAADALLPWLLRNRAEDRRS